MTTKLPNERGDVTLAKAVSRRIFDRASGQYRHTLASITLAIGYLAQVSFQMLYFLVLVRMLGPDVFGQFAAGLAAVLLVSPLAGLGYGELALVRISQRPQDAGLWAANALAATLVLGLIVSFGLAGGYVFLTSGNWLRWHEILGLAICELVVIRSCGVIARVHQASGNVWLTSLNNSLLSGARAIIAGAVYLSGSNSIGVLMVSLLIGLTPLGIVFYVSLVRRWGPLKISWRQLQQEFRLAVTFAVGMSSVVIYTDLDKLMLARWTTAAVVGTYSAGYKILTMSFMPIRAVLEATVAQQYRLGTSNPTECIRFTGKLLAAGLTLATLISGSLYALAPYATVILGQEFESSVSVLRLGVLLPAIQTAHTILANYLTAIGRQSWRTWTQIVTLVVYVITGYVAIQHFSWTGAIYCSLGCEALLAVLLLTGSVYFTERTTFARLWQTDPVPAQVNIKTQ
jgi:O-antigen/teichoic acid export membrane protein